PGGFFTATGRAPGVVRSDIAVTHDGEGDLILCDHRFVGHPFVVRFRIQGTQSTAVSHHRPGALRGFAAGFPAEYDFARYPGVGLHMPHLEWYGDDMFDLPAFEIHFREA